MNWQHLFNHIILERGYDYYNSSRIEWIKKEEHQITAEVYGSDLYSIEINLNHSETEVIDLYCDCPYAQDGKNCKHMAAVLFALQLSKDSDSIYPLDNTIDYELLVSQLSREKLEEIILDEVKHNSTIANKLRILAIPHQDTLDHSLNLITNIIDSRSDYNDYIDYYEVGDMYYEVSSALETMTNSLIQNQEYKDAIILSLNVLRVVSEYDFDDSNGYFSMLISDVFEIINDNIESCSLAEKKDIFESFTKALSNDLNDILSSYIDSSFIDFFSNEHFYNEKIQFYKDIINREEIKKSLYPYEIEDSILSIYAILRDLCMPTSEFYSDYGKYNITQFLLANEYLEHNNIRKSIEIYEFLKSKSYRTESISRTLLDIYSLTDSRDSYIKELWDLITIHAQGDIELFSTFKETIPEKEWPSVREKIFMSINNQHALEALYIEEELYDRLLKSVMNSYELTKIMEYEKYLIENYRDSLLKKYEIVLIEMAKFAEKSNYTRIARVLTHINNVYKNNSLTNNLIELWSSQYKNRPLMIKILYSVK